MQAGTNLALKICPSLIYRMKKLTNLGKRSNSNKINKCVIGIQNLVVYNYIEKEIKCFGKYFLIPLYKNE